MQENPLEVLAPREVEHVVATVRSPGLCRSTASCQLSERQSWYCLRPAHRLEPRHHPQVAREKQQRHDTHCLHSRARTLAIVVAQHADEACNKRAWGGQINQAQTGPRNP